LIYLFAAISYKKVLWLFLDLKFNPVSYKKVLWLFLFKMFLRLFLARKFLR